MMGELGYNPYSNTNTLYRAGLMVGSDGRRPGHRILCHDPKREPPRYVIDIHVAWHSLSRRQKQCVLGKYVLTQMIDANSGRRITARDAAGIIGVSLDTFGRNASRGTQKIKTKIYM